MTLEIITLEDAKGFCRVDHDEDDWLFEVLIQAATDAAIEFSSDWTPTESTEDVPARIKLAILVHVSRAYGQHHDGADMPESAARLLSPLRRVSI